MFGRLKEKLKEALSVFSKKAEEEIKAEPKSLEPEKETIKEELRKETIKEEIRKPEAKREEEITKEKRIEKKEEIRPEKIETQKVPETLAETRLKEKLEKKEEIPSLEKKLPEGEEEKEGFFAKIKQAITTKTISAEKFDELFWDLEIALLENNVSVAVIEKIKQALKAELVNKPLPRDVLSKIEETLRQTLTLVLSSAPPRLLADIRQKEPQPYIIAFFGINGSGKTTTIAKLSHLFQTNGLKTVLAASDTFRAAAIQQLEEHAQKLNTKLIKHDYGADAAAVAFDAVKYAQKNDCPVVLIDTAGRLHSNANLMDELKKICRVVKPDLKLFVGESITGNDCIEQASRFDEAVGIDAVILTKADVDEKGGTPLSVAYTLKKPIFYLGTGQKYEDLEEFNASKILKNLGFS